MPTADELKLLQRLPLDLKVKKTELRVHEWIRHYGESGVYVAFSGGKDSTVLLDIVRKLYPNIEAVFVNTGLEYPEIQQFVKTVENVTILRPEMRFDEVIKKYGYPLLSKEIARKVSGARFGKQWAMKYIDGTATKANGEKSFYNVEKYKPLVNADFVVSSMCCNEMKKKPLHNFNKKFEKVPISAQTAEESLARKYTWQKNGCNAFNVVHPISNPMSFWTEQDVLHYIKESNLPICSVYGDVVPVNDENQTVFDWGFVDLKTTGSDRTGCIFCGFGCHLEKEPTRFQRLKETHPKQYKYCLGGGEFNERGIWQPNEKGLGLKYVFDEINKIYGENFIKYE